MDTFQHFPNYKERLSQLIDRNKYVICYGSGTVFQNLIPAWNSVMKHKIDFVCDGNSQKWNTCCQGVLCISPERLYDFKDNCVVLLTLGAFTQVAAKLKADGFQNVLLPYKYDLLTDYDNLDAELINAHLHQVFDLLEDEPSRKVFQALVRRKFEGSNDLNLMRNVYTDDQYFPDDIFQLNDRECFADVGAFDGDTAMRFIEKVKGKYQAIYAFELSKQNYRKMETNLVSYNMESKIRLFPMGASDKPADILYDETELDCKIGGGNATGRVDRLDSVLANLPVSYIKMDIEGEELSALKGCQSIIQMQKPKLAICVYHCCSHLWEIPLYIKQLNPEYKIYFRHHSVFEYETVCYAINKEKK